MSDNWLTLLQQIFPGSAFAAEVQIVINISRCFVHARQIYTA